MIEMSIPAKYKDDIDQLRNGHHGLRHRLAWALMPECIRVLTVAGLMVALHPDEVMNAIFTKALNDFADQADEANEDEEARQ